MESKPRILRESRYLEYLLRLSCCTKVDRSPSTILFTNIQN
jgi:hypothetical protein